MSIYQINGYEFSGELYHHGIKGQKWGVRRFQNTDGTLTAAGKERYSKNPALIYKNKYGEDTEVGKARSSAAMKRLEDSTLSPDDVGLEKSWESIDKYEEQQQADLKKLFENSSNPRLRDPETQKHIQKIWEDSLYAGYRSDYSSIKNSNEYKKLNQMEEERQKMWEKKVSPLFEEYRDTWKFDNPKLIDKAHKKYVNSKQYQELDRLDKEIRAQRNRLSGMVKMRTMNEIMRTVTPEMRDTVFDMLNYYWHMD